MNTTEELLNNCDEFVIITAKKNNDTELNVGVIMSCDPTGPMLDVLENIVKDARDAAKCYTKCAETNSNQTQSDSNSPANCTTVNY